MRKVIHIDMDAFYASVEQRDDPDLRGRPVVVAWKGRRSVVCAASYEARRYGIHSAMPAMQAERLCPQAVFVPPNFDKYQHVSRQINHIFSRHTDLIQPLSLDEAYLDVSTNKTGLNSATAVAQAIRQAIAQETGLTASAGVAGNKFLAKIASDWHKPNGLCVIRPEQALDFLASLPVARLPGVGRVMELKLKNLGIQTTGELRHWELAALESEFGRWGQRLYQLARGIDETAVQVPQAPKQISSEDTFASDLRLDQLKPHLHRLATSVWATAQQQAMPYPHTITLKLKTQHFVSLTRSTTLPRPPHSSQQLVTICELLCARVTQPAATRYRLLGIGLSGFKSEAIGLRQAELFWS